MLGFWGEPTATATATTATTTTTATFHYWTSETAFTADLWVKAVEAWLSSQHEPSVLVLDNASSHRALLVRAGTAKWRERGLTLFYLPPYAPELNRIDLLWHHFRHCWLAPADYATDQTRFLRINAIASEINNQSRITSG